MSYIRANKVDMEQPKEMDHGCSLPEIDFSATSTVDCNLDDEILSAAIEILDLIDRLREDEALVIWKEIF